jgi:hypothetical protein
MVSRRKPKRGVVLVATLACLGIVAVLLASATQYALRHRNEIKIEKMRMQASLLCEAGWYRAANKLVADADYKGEDWQPQLIGPQSADSNAQSLEPTRVLIACEPTADGKSVVATVTATIGDPNEQSRFVSVTHEFSIENFTSLNQEPK